MPKGRGITDMFQKIGVLPGQSRTAQTATSAEDVVRITAQLERVLDQHPDVGGHLFLLDFHDAKRAMGKDWDASTVSIHNKIEDIIANHLAPYDMQIKKDDQTYLVLLPSLNSDEGQIKAQMISEEIATALLGAAGKNRVGVKILTTAASGHLKAKATTPMPTMLDKVSSRLDAMPASAPGAAGRAARGAPMAPVEYETAPASRTLENLSYIFRPLLSVKSKIISTYLCIPIKEVAPGHFLSGYGAISPSGHLSEVSELDLAACDKVAEELQVLTVTNKRSLLGLPVHFSTLTDPYRRSAYLGKCHTHFSDNGHRLVFELNGLPDGVPEARLFEIVGLLKPTSRSVIARLPTSHTKFGRHFKDAGIHAVGVDVFNARLGETELLHQLDAFARNAQNFKLKTYISGVRSLSVFTAAITSGFDYIAGYALSKTAASAEDISQFRLDSIYISLLRDYGILPPAKPGE